MDHGIDDILARNYLDQALNHVSDGVAVFDADDRLIACNENYKSLYGKHREIVVPGATFDALIRASVALGLTPHSGIDGDDYSELRLRDFKARKGAEFQTFDGRLIEASEHPLADGGVAHICVDVTRRRRAEESREHAEILRQHAERIAHLGSWEIDYSSDQVKWSDEVYRVLGLDRESFDGRQESFLELVHPDDRRLVRKQREDIADGRPYDYTYRIVRPDGSERMVHVGGEVIRAVGGDPELARGFIHDITEHKQAEDALRESKERLDEAQRIAQVGSFTHDFHGDVNHWSDEHYRIFGVEPLGKKISQVEFMALVHPGDRESVAEAVRQAIELHKPYDLEHRIVRPDGAVHVVHGRGEVTFGEDHKPLSLRGTVQDITERREAEQQVRYLAHHDALTDLPNRHLFEDRLEKAMAIATRHDQHVAVHFIDLNRFKQVNDALGHAVGDELLKAVGTVLKGVVRATDTLARFGGDEFTVIQTELVDPQDAAILAQKIIDAISQPFRIAGHRVHTGATIGIAVYPNDGTEATELLQQADFALYSGKAKGRNTYEFFDKKMRAALANRQNLEEELSRALEREEFLVYYQPRIELSTGLITGVESLVRWRHPERGIVLPNEFIPSAEHSGLIRPIGEWVLRTACMDAAAWRQAGLPPLSIAVNLSAAQFHDTDLVDLVKQVLEASGLEPGLLELEITETLMMKERDTKVVPTLVQLRELGVQISVDDFGTGYASLTYLRHFPVSKVKVDQSFVQGIIGVAQDKAIVEAVIKLGHGLKLAVTAEGVETQEVVSFLKAWNCDEAQGYLFSKPLAAEELILLLKDQVTK